jgi:hypothetical protein
MDWLERELKGALTREEPSADFASRVLRRTSEPVRPVYRWPQWLAAAAAVIVLAGAGLGYRQYRGEMAKEQVMQAFKITSVKVNRIQTAVEGAGK